MTKVLSLNHLIKKKVDKFLIIAILERIVITVASFCLFQEMKLPGVPTDTYDFLNKATFL